MLPVGCHWHKPRPLASFCPEMRYNITADVQHKEGFPSRFYFHGNGTSNVTSGEVRANAGERKCATHQAFMRVSTNGHTLYDKTVLEVSPRII